jgi:hypothetical protein
MIDDAKFMGMACLSRTMITNPNILRKKPIAHYHCGIRSILVTPCTGNNDYEILSRHGMWTMYLQGLHKESHAWQLAVFLITS